MPPRRQFPVIPQPYHSLILAENNNMPPPPPAYTSVAASAPASAPAPSYYESVPIFQPQPYPLFTTPQPPLDADFSARFFCGIAILAVFFVLFYNIVMSAATLASQYV